jgi:hypothetical protein
MKQNLGWGNYLGKRHFQDKNIVCGCNSKMEFGGQVVRVGGVLNES